MGGAAVIGAVVLAASVSGLFGPASPAPAPESVAPAELRILPPADGLHAGRAALVGLVSLDESGSILPPGDSAAPTLRVRGGKPLPVEAVVPGLWRAEVSPAAAGKLTFDASLGALEVSLPVSVQGAASITLALSKTVLPPDHRGKVVATVEIKDGKGAPIDGRPPSIESTSGTVDAPKRVAPGRWTARVPLPAKKHPQVVLVVATVPGFPGSAVPVTLTQRGLAKVPLTTKPGSSITVRVGRKSFGPLRANAYGEVIASIDASPADESMQVESVDDVGNKSVRNLPLPHPPFPRLWAMADAGETWLDGRTTVSIQAVMLGRNGALSVSGPLEAKVAGQVVPLTRKGQVFTGRARLALPSGEVEVTVDGAGSKYRSKIEIQAAPPVELRLVVSPEWVSALGTPTEISARLVDAAGRSVKDGTVAFSADGLAISGIRNDPGQTSAKVTLLDSTGAAPRPGDLSGARKKGTPAAAKAALPEARILARAPGAGFTIAARRVLPVRAGPPAIAEFLGEPARLLADGNDSAEIDVRISDEKGYPVMGLTPDLLSSPGEARYLREEEPGRYVFELKAPSASGAGNGSLVFELGAARAEQAIVFLRPPSRRDVAFGLGGQNNLGALSSALAWVEGRHSIGGTGAWAATARLAGKRGAFTVPGAASDVDVGVSQGAALFGLRRRLNAPLSRWSLFGALAAGPGLAQVVQSTGHSGSGPTVNARAAVSGERKLGGGAIAVEAGYEWSTATDRNLIRGQLAGAEITMGYRHGF